MNSFGTKSTNKPPKEEFISHGGQYICLGKYKNKEKAQLEYKGQMLTHTMNNDYVEGKPFEKGLNQTRFGKGFQRRPQNQISNLFSGEDHQKRVEYSNAKAKRSENTSVVRSKFLQDVGGRTTYDIISGNPKPVTQFSTFSRPEGIKYLGDGLGSEAPARGKVILRESQGRYYTPFPSGPSQDLRQKTLVTEGLSHNKTIGCIQIGKAELPSYGVEDQFSKSEYTKNSEVTRRGLNETREPGKFTPRKFPNNPSGNPEIVKQWTAHVDIHNRTMHCNT